MWYMCTPYVQILGVLGLSWKFKQTCNELRVGKHGGLKNADCTSIQTMIEDNFFYQYITYLDRKLEPEKTARTF